MVRQFKSQLRNFLYSAHHRGYASGKPGTPQKDGSRTVAYSRINWAYQDNYFGGDPFGGREVVSFMGKPQYLMVYYGKVAADTPDVSEVFRFLRKALSESPRSDPYRGPKSFRLGSLSYRNSWKGDVFGFSGKEAVYQNGCKVYAAQYSGGLVCRRRG